jgi:hypothetical protein
MLCKFPNRKNNSASIVFFCIWTSVQNVINLPDKCHEFSSVVNASMGMNFPPTSPQTA